MEKEIKYEDINLIGMELFRKNNENFYKSNLSPIMKKIFIAANKNINIENADDEYYMKSGILPNKVFYIYSDKLMEEDPNKLYDVVYFNSDICIWFYSNNVINMIDMDPVKTIFNIYTILNQIFRKKLDFITTISESLFLDIENKMATMSMVVNLIKFLHETYGVLDINKCIDDMISLIPEYTYESSKKFIENVLDNCNTSSYFKNREYLESYLLLESKPDEIDLNPKILLV